IVVGQTFYSPYAFTTMSTLGSSGTPLFVLSPYDVCVDKSTNLYIACYNDYTIRKISTADGTNWSISICRSVGTKSTITPLSSQPNGRARKVRASRSKPLLNR